MASGAGALLANDLADRAQQQRGEAAVTAAADHQQSGSGGHLTEAIGRVDAVQDAVPQHQARVLVSPAGERGGDHPVRLPPRLVWIIVMCRQHVDRDQRHPTGAGLLGGERQRRGG
jgi:hypothetical protein